MDVIGMAATGAMEPGPTGTAGVLTVDAGFLEIPGNVLADTLLHDVPETVFRIFYQLMARVDVS